MRRRGRYLFAMLEKKFVLFVEFCFQEKRTSEFFHRTSRGESESY